MWSGEETGGRSANWQRYEEATFNQRRPADPTDPGDAADLSIMGYSEAAARRQRRDIRPAPFGERFAQGG
ncbi:MAG: hypothetical protein CMH69_06370 [Nitratireductor sp.]|nr:hypothetical protein [Nitratireductor sp.]